MKLLAILLRAFPLIAAGGCLCLVMCVGCVSPQLSNPSLEIRRDAKGFWAKAGSDVDADIETTYDPVTGNLTSLKSNVVSKASKVVDAEGRRAVAVTEMYKVQADMLNAMLDRLMLLVPSPVPVEVVEP